MEGDITGEAGTTLIEKREEKIKKVILNWFKDPYNLIFLGIFVLAVAVRIYFLYISINQTVWWDAADYLTEAKVLAGKLNIQYYFTPRRTFLLPLLWAGFMKLGFGEVSFRILEFLFSVATIPAVYLLGKKMFDKKIALISSFLFAVFWMHLFYSNRLMTEVPSLTFLIFSLYFFWEAYANKKEKMYIWFGVFLGLSFLVRAGTLVMFAVFPIFLLLTEKLKILKSKYLWLGVLSTAGLAVAFFIFTSIKQHLNAFSYFLALTPKTAAGEAVRFSDMMGLPGIMQYVNITPLYFGTIFLILFIFGALLVLFNLFIGFDIILKRKSSNYDKYLFIALLVLVPFIFQAIFYNHAEDRYLMNAFPAVFIMMSCGLVKMGGFMKKYNKYLGIFVIVILLLVGAYWQIGNANLIITNKISTYEPVKDAALWIKANSNSSAVVLSRSVPQTTYYAEREVLNIPENQSDFEKLIKDAKPDFLELSIWEPHPQWIYSYPENHTDLLTPVQGYQYNGQTSLVIYKIKQ